MGGSLALALRDYSGTITGVEMNPAAREYARLPFKRARFDRLLAAHALSLGVTIITNNESDFADVPGLTVENWTLL